MIIIHDKFTGSNMIFYKFNMWSRMCKIQPIPFPRSLENMQYIFFWQRLLGLLFPGPFPDQSYRVGREVIKNKVDFFKMNLTHGNLSKQTVWGGGGGGGVKT